MEEAPKPEAKPAEETRKEDPALAKLCGLLGIDPAKGEAIKTEGVSGKLPKPLEGVTHILYRQSESGQLEPFAFLSAGSGVDLDRYNDQSISVAGTIYKVPNWNRPLVRVDSVSAARK